MIMKLWRVLKACNGALRAKIPAFTGKKLRFINDSKHPLHILILCVHV